MSYRRGGGIFVIAQKILPGVIASNLGTIGVGLGRLDWPSIQIKEIETEPSLVVKTSFNIHIVKDDYA